MIPDQLKVDPDKNLNYLLRRGVLQQLNEKLEKLTEKETADNWRDVARPEQLAPGWEWFVWLLLAGRGFGKTRTGVQWLHEQGMAGDERRWMAIVGRTPADVRDVILNGPGGLLTNAPKHEMPEYSPSRRRVTWPTGAYATIYSGANPEQLRGFSGDRALLDELAAFDLPQETWDMLMFGMREAKISDPQVVVTTTPKPIPLLKELLKKEGEWVAVTRGSSYDNRANLAKRYYDVVIAPYEGTRLGRQEIHAELLEDVEGALWTLELIDRLRRGEEAVPDLDRLVVAVDPAVTANKATSDETGIIVVGTGWCNCKGEEELHGFVMQDASDVLKSAAWGNKTLSLYDKFEADYVVGEVNNGGDLVERNLRACRQDGWKFKEVRASRGKYTRAEPVASLYEQGKVHHIGTFPQLEDQMTQWVPDTGQDSPDRMDALVWGLTELMVKRIRVLGSPDEYRGYRPA